MDREKIEKLILIHKKLLKYFLINEHKGIDWSSVQYGKKYLQYTNSKNKFFKKVKLSVVSRIFNFFGHHVLFLFEPIEKQYFTKAICLYLMSKLNTENRLGAEDLLMLDILKTKKIPNSNLYAHDVSYTIMNSSITDKTPNLVTTYFVAELYFQLYMKFSKDEYKRTFKLIITDLLLVIPYFKKSEKEICFQYTPVSKYNVHNANLLFCELLVKYNFLYPNNDKFEHISNLIRYSLSYTLNDFEKTGTYFYAGKETRNKNIDNYHTGYVLRSLNEIYTYGNNLESFNLKDEIDSILKFYIDTFISSGKYIYKFKQKNIESHSLAESMIIYSIFYKNIDSESRRDYLKKIFNSIDILYDKNNHKFYNKIITYMGFPIKKDKLDYIRWSQAWMLYGISLLQNKASK